MKQREEPSKRSRLGRKSQFLRIRLTKSSGNLFSVIHSKKVRQIFESV